jgi:aminobenzoyl-glutamate transport protein
MTATGTTVDSGNRTFSQKLLDGIERAGNKVPHPVIIFLYLIVGVFILSAILDLLNAGITEEILVPASPEVVEANYVGGTLQPTGIVVQEQSDEYVIEEQTIQVRSLLSIEGIRFVFTSFVSNFANFSVVATIFVTMIGVGVAEQAGMMAALIRKLVAVTPGA